MTAYKCKHCGKTVKRDSTKQWVKSYCADTGKTVHLQKVIPRAGRGGPVTG